MVSTCMCYGTVYKNVSTYGRSCPIITNAGNGIGCIVSCISYGLTDTKNILANCCYSKSIITATGYIYREVWYFNFTLDACGHVNWVSIHCNECVWLPPGQTCPVDVCTIHLGYLVSTVSQIEVITCHSASENWLITVVTAWEVGYVGTGKNVSCTGRGLNRLPPVRYGQGYLVILLISKDC